MVAVWLSETFQARIPASTASSDARDTMVDVVARTAPEVDTTGLGIDEVVEAIAEIASARGLS